MIRNATIDDLDGLVDDPLHKGFVDEGDRVPLGVEHVHVRVSATVPQ